MSKLLLLLKINLLSLFKKDSTTNKKNWGLLLFVSAFIYLMFTFYEFASLMIKGYIQLNIPYLLLVQFMVVSSIMILFTNIYKVNGTLFNIKDYNLLMSLPINRSVVITSKVIYLYLNSLLYTIVFMIPSFVAYVQNIDCSLAFYLLFFVTMFIIPVVPLIISIIIGTIITGISSKFKRKNIINYIFTIGLFLVVMFFSSKLNNMEAIDMANIGKSMVNAFNKFYPLTNIYMGAINNNLLDLFLYISIPITLFAIFILGINRFYIRINNNLNSFQKQKDYKLSISQKSNALMALYKKEVKRYFSSVMYVMNTGIGAVMLTLCILGYVIMGSDKINTLIGIEGFSIALVKYAPLLMGVFCMINCSTHSAISLEGSNFWIIKSIPVKVKEIFWSKILVNLTILIPAIIINGTVLSIYLKTNFILTLLMFITPTIYALFISILGLILNLHFPNFNWKSEVRVVKQSLPSLLAMMIGIAFGLIPLAINYNGNSIIYILIITLIMAFLTSTLYWYLNTRGKRLFNKLH